MSQIVICHGGCCLLSVVVRPYKGKLCKWMTLEHFGFALEQQKVERISPILSQFLGSGPSKEQSPLGCGKFLLHMHLQVLPSRPSERLLDPSGRPSAFSCRLSDLFSRSSNSSGEPLSPSDRPSNPSSRLSDPCGRPSSAQACLLAHRSLWVAL